MRSTRTIKWPLWPVVFIVLFVLSAGACFAEEKAVVRINTPAYDSNHTLGDTIYFTCSVKDSRGADVAGADLVWISSLDGRIGKGHTLTTDKLSMGIHMISLNAANGSGAIIGSDAIKIKVSYVSQNSDADESGVIGIGNTSGEGYVVNPMY